MRGREYDRVPRRAGIAESRQRSAESYQLEGQEVGDMSESDITQRPDSSLGDTAHTLAKAGLSMVPLVGGPIAELLEFITPPITKRRDEWMETIAQRLKMLEERVEGFRLEDLAQNEVFVTAFLQASQVAIRTHQQEKREALRNAVLNAALPNAPDDDLQQMFLSYVDVFTSWHLRVLKFLGELREQALEYEAKHPGWGWGEPETVFEDFFPELKTRPDFYTQILKDLSEKGLTDRDNLQFKAMTTLLGRQQQFRSRLTPFGKQFLGFITSPIEDEITLTNG
jgi:hypothetical protein